MQRLLMRVAMTPPWAAISWKSYLPKPAAGCWPPDFGEYRDQVVASLRRPGYAKAFSGTTRTSHDPAEARLADVTAPALVVMGEQDPDFPDPRAEADWIARALRAGGVPVSQVTGPLAAKGSRPFQATGGDGRPLFVKVFGSDQRDADLLYRAYRGIRLRGVGDTSPAASLLRAVEHEALVAVMAERAGVAVPHVGQVIKAGDGSVLLTMELIPGRSLDRVPADSITDELAREVWREVSRLHQARIAHRSLHGTNIMIGQDGCPRLADVSFAELAATSRQRAIDVAELLTSLAGRIGPDRAAATAAAASAAALIGSVPGHVPFGPAVLVQGASSFINRYRQPTSAGWR